MYRGKANCLAVIASCWRGLCIGWENRWGSRWVNRKNKEVDEEETLLRLLHEAHREWMEALAYFDLVAEPDLVDYAIYRLGAAENRYRCLLRRARNQGWKAFDPFDPAQLVSA